MTVSQNGSFSTQYEYGPNGLMRRSIPPFFNLPITTWKYDHNDRVAHIEKDAWLGVSGVDLVGKSYENFYTEGKYIKHLYFAGQKLASIESTGEIKYYHSDLRGSAKYVTDDFGNVLETRLYKPHGQEYQSSGSSGYLPYRFNDRRDETNGTLRFPLRNLSDQNYHWTALDPIIRTSPSASVKNIGNPFSYAGYDPVNNVDLLGAANIPIFRPIPLPSTEKSKEEIYVPDENIITITADRPDQNQSSGSGSDSETTIIAALPPGAGNMFGMDVEIGDNTTWVPIGIPFAGGIFSGVQIGGALAVRGAVALGNRAWAWLAGAGTGIASALRRVFNAAHSAAAGGVGLAERATTAASRYPKQLQQALRMTPQQLEKFIGSFSGRISQHQGFLRNPQSHVPNWSQLTPQHQQNLIHHWTNDISRHEAYRDIAEAVLRGAL